MRWRFGDLGIGNPRIGDLGIGDLRIDDLKFERVR